MVSLASALDRIKRIALPTSLHMAFNAAVSRLAADREAEISALDRLSRGRNTAVDIGANCGYYTYAMSRIFKTVWAFEANPAICRPIEAARCENIRLETVALSSREGRAVLRIPIVNGQALPGWATLGRNDLSDVSRDIDVRTATLDSYEIVNVDFIKIDVEGHENSVLEGAVKTISSSRPFCLIEIGSGHSESVEQFFRALQYTPRRTWNGVTMSPQNVLFVPDES